MLHFSLNFLFNEMQTTKEWLLARGSFKYKQVHVVDLFTWVTYICKREMQYSFVKYFQPWKYEIIKKNEIRYFINFVRSHYKMSYNVTEFYAFSEACSNLKDRRYWILNQAHECLEYTVNSWTI